MSKDVLRALGFEIWMKGVYGECCQPNDARHFVIRLWLLIVCVS